MTAHRPRSGARTRSGPSRRLAVMALLMASGSPTFASPVLPSIVAEHVRVHEASGFEIARVRVELAPEGLRLHARDAVADLEVVQDFTRERLWLVDRARRVAHAPAPLDGTEDESDSPADLLPRRGSFLGPEPCAGESSLADGGGRWRGRRVNVWRCVDPASVPVAIELVDREHGIVIRRETPDGIVDELRDIRVMRFPPGHFVPSARYRRVGEQEFLSGAPPIAAFDEESTP